MRRVKLPRYKKARLYSNGFRNWERHIDIPMEGVATSFFVSPQETLLQSLGSRDGHKLALEMPIEKECITSLVALSLEDTRLCFVEYSRRIIADAICRAAISLIKSECLGCRIEDCGQPHLEYQHTICKKSPDELLRTPTYAAYFIGFLFAGGPGGFLVDNRYYNKIAPYVNINSLVEGKGLGLWFPPTTILGVFLRKAEGFESFLTGDHPTKVKDLSLDVGEAEDVIALFMLDIVCPQSTRALVVIENGEKELKRFQERKKFKTGQAVSKEGETVYRGIKRVRREKETEEEEQDGNESMG